MGPPPGPVVAQLHLWIRYPLCFKRFVPVFIVFSTHWVNISFEVLHILRCRPTPRRGVRGSQVPRLHTECAQNVSDFSHYPYLLLFVAIHRLYLLLVVAIHRPYLLLFVAIHNPYLLIFVVICCYSPSIFVAICCYSPSLFVAICCPSPSLFDSICCYSPSLFVAIFCYFQIK